METLEGVGNILSEGMTIKAECDYWNSHSDSYKTTIIAQYFYGLLLALACLWCYTHNPVGSVNSSVPIFIFFGYTCVCSALNNQRNLREQSFVSNNFSEFWLFGFFKGGNFLCGVIFGWLGTAFCMCAILSSLFLHMTIPINIAGLAPASAPIVVHTVPVATQHHVVQHKSHSAHKSATVHHPAVAAQAHFASTH